MIIKRYYKIEEVAKLINVETSTIRFWETSFGMLHTKKSLVNKRKLFNRDAVDKIIEIHRLLKIEKHTIEGAIDKFSTTGRITAEEFYKQHFKTTEVPRGEEILSKQYDYEDLIGFAEEYNKL